MRVEKANAKHPAHHRHRHRHRRRHRRYRHRQTAQPSFCARRRRRPISWNIYGYVCSDAEARVKPEKGGIRKVPTTTTTVVARLEVMQPNKHTNTHINTWLSIFCVNFSVCLWVSFSPETELRVLCGVVGWTLSGQQGKKCVDGQNTNTHKTNEVVVIELILMALFCRSLSMRGNGQTNGLRNYGQRRQRRQ